LVVSSAIGFFHVFVSAKGTMGEQVHVLVTAPAPCALLPKSWLERKTFPTLVKMLAMMIFLYNSKGFCFGLRESRCCFISLFFFMSCLSGEISTRSEAFFMAD